MDHCLSLNYSRLKAGVTSHPKYRKVSPFGELRSRRCLIAPNERSTNEENKPVPLLRLRSAKKFTGLRLLYSVSEGD